MAGFKPLEHPAVLKWAVTVPLGNTSTSPLSVMHPMHCLEARIENICGTLLNRRASEYGERYVSRVRLAIEACRRIGQQCAEAEGTEMAGDIAEHVHTLSYLRSALRARYGAGSRPHCIAKAHVALFIAPASSSGVKSSVPTKSIQQAGHRYYVQHLPACRSFPRQSACLVCKP